MVTEVLIGGDIVEIYYRNAQQKIYEELRQKDENVFLNNPEQTIIQQFYDKYVLQIIEEDASRELSYNPVTIKREGRPDFLGNLREFEVEYYDIEIPLKPKPSNIVALRLQAAREWPIWTEISGEKDLYQKEDNVLIVRVSSGRTETRLETVRRKISLLNHEIELYTSHFWTNVERLVVQRKAEVADRITKRQQELQALGIKPKEKPSLTKPVNASKPVEGATKSDTGAKATSQLKVFLNYSSTDGAVVHEIYKRLQADGYKPWLDSENLIGGQDWELEIRKAVRNSDVVIICLSHKSVNKQGFVQKELRFAFDVAEEKPEGMLYIIPVRLEECELPEHVKRLHYIDFFRDGGYELLVKALKTKAGQL